MNIFTVGNDSKYDDAEMGDSPLEIKPKNYRFERLSIFNLC